MIKFCERLSPASRLYSAPGCFPRMRGFLRTHFPAVAGFLAMALVAGSLAVLFPVPSGGAGGGHAPFSVGAIPLPGPGEDDDGDGDEDGGKDHSSSVV